MLARVAKLPSKVSSSRVNLTAANNIYGLASLLCNITIASQNCNSLNISTTCPKQLKKIYSIAELGTDIIFLSDLRLNDNPNLIRDIENSFLACSKKPYIFFHNSTKNSRGTGILIAQNIEISIINEFKDPNENILGLHVTLRGKEMLLLSIYGPNNNHLDCETLFFECLDDVLSELHDIPVICGGDWNCTLIIM